MGSSPAPPPDRPLSSWNSTRSTPGQAARPVPGSRPAEIGRDTEHTVNSAHGLFARPAARSSPLELELDPFYAGPSGSARSRLTASRDRPGHRAHRELGPWALRPPRRPIVPSRAGTRPVLRRAKRLGPFPAHGQPRSAGTPSTP